VGVLGQTRRSKFVAVQNVWQNLIHFLKLKAGSVNNANVLVSRHQYLPCKHEMEIFTSRCKMNQCKGSAEEFDLLEVQRDNPREQISVEYGLFWSENIILVSKTIFE